MQLLHLGMNMLKGRIRLEWDSWIAGKVKTGRKQGREGRERSRAFPSELLRDSTVFSHAHGASPAVAPGVSLSASALRPVLECCRQLGVM